MLRKMIYTLVGGLVVSVPLASPLAVQAQNPIVEVTLGASHHRYFVEYRPGRHTAWSVSGPYHSQRHAHEVARGLRVQGFHTRVVQR